jgi:hypothetical protein
MLNWKNETHGHHEAALKIQLAVRVMWAKRRIEIYRRARTLVAARLLREDELREMRYKEEMRRLAEFHAANPVLKKPDAVACVTKLQAWARMCLARDAYQWMRQDAFHQRKEALRKHAAMRIQSVSRGYLVRNRLFIERHPEVIEHNRLRRRLRSVGLLQATIRTFLVKCQMQRLVNSVLQIQRVVRGWIGRRATQRQRRWLSCFQSTEENDFAANVVQRSVQAHFRRRLVQRWLKEVTKATTCIQAWYRAILVGRESRRLAKRHARVWMRAMERSYQEYRRLRTAKYTMPPKDVREEMAALEAINRKSPQSAVTRRRQQLLEQWGEVDWQTSRRIQSRWVMCVQDYGNKEQNAEVQHVAAVTIQNFFKMVVARKQLRRHRKSVQDQHLTEMGEDAATLIQASYRGYHSRRSFSVDTGQGGTFLRLDPNMADEIRCYQEFEDYENDRYTAALLLQRHLKAVHDAKKERRYRKMQRIAAENPKAVLVLQQFGRAYYSRYRTASLRLRPLVHQTALQTRSAIRIQAAWRGYLARQKCAALQNDELHGIEEEERAFLDEQARKIQTFFRLVVQYQGHSEPDSGREEAAAARIQGFQKMVQGRADVERRRSSDLMNMRDEACFVIQLHWRLHKVRQERLAGTRGAKTPSP